eukprot:13882915-Heterocapsa_arctica.AAC.1
MQQWALGQQECFVLLNKTNNIYNYRQNPQQIHCARWSVQGFGLGLSLGIRLRREASSSCRHRPLKA